MKDYSLAVQLTEAEWQELFPHSETGWSQREMSERASVIVRTGLQMWRELLSDDELIALDLTAQLANTIRKIIANGGASDADMDRFDWAEAAAKIHDIQHMLMAQAAARAYPERFRLMGRKIGQ